MFRRSSSITVVFPAKWNHQRLLQKTFRDFLLGNVFIALVFSLSFAGFSSAAYTQEILLNPKSLDWQGDIASRMVDGVDRFLLSQIKQVDSKRVERWNSEKEKYSSSDEFLAAKRKQFARILGVRDQRLQFDSPELITTTSRPSLVARNEKIEVHAVRIPVFEGVNLEGLWLRPRQGKPQGNLIVIPDADQSPESMAGLDTKLPQQEQVARLLALQGNQVIVPTLISRKMEKRNGRANLTHREYLYRPAFELGRHLIGYEIQKVLAAVDWFDRLDPADPIGVWGAGEGGMLAMYSAALDPRIDIVAIDDFIGGRENNWDFPISRNVFGLLSDFGDAEVLSLIAPRPILNIPNPSGVAIRLPSEGGAPANLRPATPEQVSRVERDFQQHAKNLLIKNSLITIPNRGKQFSAAIKIFDKMKELDPSNPKLPTPNGESDLEVSGGKWGEVSPGDPVVRQRRQIAEIDRFNQSLLASSEAARNNFMKKLDTSTIEKFQSSVENYREIFATQVIGRFDLPLKDFNVRVRPYCDKPKYIGYEVVLDVFDDVFAYGIILLPKGVRNAERRPVVVCQHGLEGRPQDVVQGDHRAYHDFAAKLAEEGFITFSPQNIYIFTDRFRTLQRKANTIGKTLFSIMVPQHQQIVNWLKTLPNVDPKRIAFYGLSYGGKSAMRIPPLVPDYCLSICSADFNEWVWKNASTTSRYSYVWTGEYEIFEFDLGSTFNYAEMATLIAPRPFMVERGHYDGVSSDERVAYEFAKVRNLYQARLKIGDRCEIEFFDGPHTINGQGTFQFLRKHLQFPAKN